MKKFMPLFVVSLAMIFCACASTKPMARTNYTAPSTSKLGLNISSAQDSATSAGVHAKKNEAAVTAAAAKAKTAKDRIVVLENAVKDQPSVLSLAKQVEGDIDDLTALLLNANDENKFLQNDITTTLEQLKKAQDEKVILQADVLKQTTLLNTANRERNEAITQGAIDKRNAHRFKAIIIGVSVFAVGAIMFGLFKFAAFAPPLVYATIAAPTAVGVFLYFWLGSS